MSKHNRNGRKKKQHFERRQGSDLIEIQRDGISLISVGPDDATKPDEIQMIWHVPGAPNAQLLIFREPEQLGALIEQMIAHRNFVFPDADPIDPDVQLEKREWKRDA